MIRLSARRYALPPLSLRLLVVLLALVQFVAPTWHICSMGGHVMSMSETSGMGSHEGMAPAAEANEDGPPRALICYCAPKSHDENPNGPKLFPASSHDEHATCLALLLQNMPGAVATVPALVLPSTLIEARFQVRHETSPTLAILSRFRGRAPPLAV